MPTTAEHLYQEALSLPLEARADLTERLVATLAEEIPSEITRAQLDGGAPADCSSRVRRGGAYPRRRGIGASPHTVG